MKLNKLCTISLIVLGLLSISQVNSNASHRYGWWQTRTERRAHNSCVDGQLQWDKSHGFLKRHKRHYRHHYRYYYHRRARKHNYNDINNGYVNRTKSHRLLDKSGYLYNGELYGYHSPLDYRSYIPKNFKLKKGMLWNIRPDYIYQYTYNGHGKWTYTENY